MNDMNRELIHENLNTAFVDVSALVRHLSGLQFVGGIHIELSSYEADIIFNGGKKVAAREYDHTAGRFAEGDHALKRILIRAQDPCGHISVYAQRAEADDPERVFIDRAIAAEAKRAAGEMNSPAILSISPIKIGAERPGKVMDVLNKKRSAQGEDEMWRDRLELTAELLRSMDSSFAAAKLDFEEAFRNACGIFEADHTFLSPESGFTYHNGRISLPSRPLPEIFAAGIASVIRHILTRVAERRHFGRLHQITTHRMRVLLHRKKGHYERLGMARRLETLLGI